VKSESDHNPVIGRSAPAAGGPPDTPPGGPDASTLSTPQVPQAPVLWQVIAHLIGLGAAVGVMYAIFGRGYALWTLVVYIFLETWSHLRRARR
jgi:hypothetical protein